MAINTTKVRDVGKTWNSIDVLTRGALFRCPAQKWEIIMSEPDFGKISNIAREVSQNCDENSYPIHLYALKSPVLWLFQEIEKGKVVINNHNPQNQAYEYSQKFKDILDQCTNITQALQ